MKRRVCPLHLLLFDIHTISRRSLLLLTCLVTSKLFCGIYVSQVGYRPSDPKYVLVDQAADSFYVADASSGTIRFSGKFRLWRSSDPVSGLTIYRGDFPGFATPGLYRIKTSGGVQSQTFAVHDTVYNAVWRKSLKGFFFQRCGTALSSTYAGIYNHPLCHGSDATFHATAESVGVISATGGWHDAGDYGKYVVNTGVTVGTLLLAYEMFPDRFAADDVGIPESGNGIPDLLDETRYELEWLLKMQSSGGGVFTKLTPTQEEGLVMPNADGATRYIYQISSTATADFAAIMARAARIYKAFDADFSQRCLAAATKGWQFLENNPSIVPAGGFHNPPGTSTGEYADADDSDERLWAAAEMLATTNDQKYGTYYSLHYSAKGLFSQSMLWQDVTALAHLTYLTADFTGKDPTIGQDLKSSLQSFCQVHVDRRTTSGFPVTLTSGEFIWGSNSVALNNAILLIAGSEILGTSSYRDIALDQLQYILGVNPYAMSYVTGIGSKRPLHPHHRPSIADNITEPVPGLLVGGPNQNLSDPILKLLFKSTTPPALCYTDNLLSYASNEIAINWNAPLVFVAGYLSSTITPITFTISGNAGVAGAMLSYRDTTDKVATADGTGAYSFTVSHDWSGTVTPSLAGCGFIPASRTYADVLGNQTGQNYSEYIVANTKVFLQGPFSGGAMTTTLDTSGYIPHTSDSAYSAATYGYTASTVSSIPNTSIVDWLLVELRSDTAGATKVAGRAGFLKSNGTVVDTDGVSALRYAGALPGNYYVVVRHRDHLSIMSAAAVALSGTSALYDFTTAQTQAYGTSPMVALPGGAFGMIAGDVNQDGIVKYNLTSNDRALIYVRIGGGLVNATVKGYYPEDVNLDGVVKYNLGNNDRGIIYVNIGSGSVNGTVSTKVPK